MEDWQIITLIIWGLIVLVIIISKIMRHRFKKVWIFRRIKETPTGKETSYFIQGVNKKFGSQEEAEYFARRLK